MKPRTPLLLILVVINFVFTLHYTVGAYINSSFLEQFLDVKYVGLVFTVSALLAIIGLSKIEHLLVRFGNYYLALFLLLIDIVALACLAVYGFLGVMVHPLLPIILFIAHYATAVFLLRVSLDIYFEEETIGGPIGSLRGKLLTASNLAWFVSPIIFGQLLADGDFWKIYTLATFLAVVLLFFILRYLKHTHEPRYRKIYLRGTLKEVWKNKDIFRVFVANFLLHFFFSWMVIYLPIYLHDHIGFSWEEIGFMLSLTLIAYILIDIPLGYISDKLGEKELLQLGFLLTFAFTFPIALISEATFLIWTITLFGARLGAGTLEVMTDVYFFKKISDRDANLITFYRNSPPLSYILGPLVGSILLATGAVSEGYLFLVLSGILFLGLFIVTPLRDTN